MMEQQQLQLKMIEVLLRIEEKMDLILNPVPSAAPKPYYTPEEAARTLGFSVTKSGNYSRRLKYCRTHGLLTKWYNSRPYHYDKHDVDALAEKLRAGKVYLPKAM